MDIKMFYKTQREVAETINKVIDAYWEDVIDDQEMSENLKKIYDNNTSKVIKNGDMTTVIKQQCGKRRLEIVKKLLITDGYKFTE